MAAMTEPARVYTVSGGSAATSGAGGTSANSTSLPDILRRSGSSVKRKRRRTAIANNEILSRIELIQDFEFPEASNKIRSTRDGNNIVATGTYKPQIRVWECEQLSLKFERHTDAENVDFLMLSDDWTKSLHLQGDRSLELQTQGGAHARVRLPRFGRALGYHFPSADAIVGAAGREVYRLNLDQGRFLAPFVLGGSDGGNGGAEVTGCNAVDVNPAHGLLCFGTEGTGVVELWDPRARRRAGVLSVATPSVMDAAFMVARRALPGVLPDDNEQAIQKEALSSLAVTAISGAEDGLNLAAGTNTGHVLLYDLRMERPYQTKDQGFGLPIKSLSWPGDKASSRAGGVGPRTRSEAEGKVLSADAKVVKVWDKETGDNLVSVTPPSSATDINDIHHYPGTGLLMAAVEGTQMAAWYVPALGPAPKWCSYIDSLTDEMDGVEGGGAGSGKGVYEDFKFLDRAELERLGMSHLVGTQLLRPYMHGYFVSLGLYDKARLLANPTAFSDARERAIKAKLEKRAESRIRAVKNAPKVGDSVRVNRELAEKVAKDAAVEARKAARSGGEAEAKAKPGATNLLEDSRFSKLFTDPEFQVDTSTREFALLNPGAADKQGQQRDGPRKLTAVEDEENESDRESLDPDQEDEMSESDHDSDSSDDGDLGQFDPRKGGTAAPLPKFEPERLASRNGAAKPERGRPRMVDSDESDIGSDEADVDVSRARKPSGGKKRTFEDRLKSRSSRTSTSRRGGDDDDFDAAAAAAAGGVGSQSFTWTPSRDSQKAWDDEAAEKKNAKAAKKKKDADSFGAGLSKGGGDEGQGVEALSDDARFGRKKRRAPGRSASKNAMRGQ
ncbi:uncharacterized protein PFL1_04820 [Pseudozyma flocculosa PF-1]|uniref:Related to ENP2 - essential nucleolar protein, required for biogenesis of the small ribosomal subunit n=2 Tax=Pseudozyma flocculosa TaxID=84751 RepID=A0A5C3F5H7_9BASI|nr:uncharacterized protein PFL1_04820 [Pseudozyma flocculosa PF-1]EPQ27682.1 hypothetical protein PFL1_04820 [Pseudozyma flocculosa PF-1]SPO39185.1 related to ENP2 - essential nucleolar protein, required for biogenesis of the small ribosomal subunit [Pseudozyma flocculosa]